MSTRNRSQRKKRATLPRYANYGYLVRRNLNEYRRRQLVSRFGKGIYVHPDGPAELNIPEWAGDDWHRTFEMATALAVAAPHAVVSRRSAAVLHGLPLRGLPSQLEVSVEQPAAAIRRPWVSCRQVGTIKHLSVATFRLATIRQTLLDLAGQLGFLELVQCFDAVLGRWHGPPKLTPVQLSQLIVGTRRYPGRKLAIAALHRARPGVDSPQETRLRLSLVDAGLPEPEVSVSVENPATGYYYLLDMAYRYEKVAVEYDGDHHRGDEAQYNRDIARLQTLEQLGWIVIRVTRRSDMSRVAHDVRAALIRRRRPRSR
ncbi:DUF559 domain-containing protein [Brevibacterium luteolum]|uniref:DUF559 domain-containing protein n=1 Tax=Brevibacterium luteolum TaxID=199591 RepID=UPI003EE8D091